MSKRPIISMISLSTAQALMNFLINLQIFKTVIKMVLNLNVQYTETHLPIIVVAVSCARDVKAKRDRI